VFRVASLSKHFTAAGILKLYESKKLLPNDKALTFISLDKSLFDKTIESFANHQSGANRNFPFESNGGDSTERIPKELCEFVSKLMSTGIDGFYYRNAGYSILSCVLQKISGLSFQEYMGEILFKPLKMTHTKVIESKKPSMINLLDRFNYEFSVSNYLSPKRTAASLRFSPFNSRNFLRAIASVCPSFFIFSP